LAERPVDVGDVAQSESDRIGVERAVGKRQLLGIAGRPGEAAQQAAIDGAVTAYAQHGGVDVAYRDVSALAALLLHALQEPKGDVAGTASHVEQLLARPRVHDIDQRVLPKAMHAA